MIYQLKMFEGDNGEIIGDALYIWEIMGDALYIFTFRDVLKLGPPIEI